MVINYAAPKAIRFFISRLSRVAFLLLCLLTAQADTLYALPLTGDGSSTAILGVFQGGNYVVSPDLTAPGNVTVRSCGLPGDLPVPGNYLSNSEAKAAVWNPSYGVWSICSANGVIPRAWGLPGDIPVPGDYSGDGFTDLAVFRPSTAEWFIAQNDGTFGAGAVDVIKWGEVGDYPVPGDYDGDGRTDPAVVRPHRQSGGLLWRISYSAGGELELPFGLLGDLPVAADYDGDGKEDIAVFRPSDGAWYFHTSGSEYQRIQFGLPGDIPSPGDIDGDGRANLIVYRPSEARFYIRNRDLSTSVLLSGTTGARAANESRTQAHDRPSLIDINGDRRSELALLRTSAAGRLQFILASTNAAPLSSSVVELGSAGDTAVPGDYDGDGITDPGIVTGDGELLLWKFLLSASQGGGRSELHVHYGLPGDYLVPADYDGDGKTDLAVVRNMPDNSKLWIPNASGLTKIEPISWGFSTDIHMTGDLDGDGRADLIVIRQAGNELLWLVRTASGEALTPRLYGFTDDEPIVGDFDGDGIDEIGVIRIVNGFRLVILENAPPFYWGLADDISLAANYLGTRRKDLAVWRTINAQGYFFIRGGGDPVLPFGVVGDIPLDGRTAVPSSDNRVPGSGGGGGSGKRLTCNAGSSNAGSQRPGFVWKPVSESDGRLAVLFESSRAGSILRAALVERRSGGDVVLETLRFSGNTNGNRPTFRGRRPGRDYPSNLILVRQQRNQSVHCITVPNPGQRYD